MVAETRHHHYDDNTSHRPPLSDDTQKENIVLQHEEKDEGFNDEEHHEHDHPAPRRSSRKAAPRFAMIEDSSMDDEDEDDQVTPRRHHVRRQYNKSTQEEVHTPTRQRSTRNNNSTPSSRYSLRKRSFQSVVESLTSEEEEEQQHEAKSRRTSSSTTINHRYSFRTRQKQEPQSPFAFDEYRRNRNTTSSSTRRMEDAVPPEEPRNRPFRRLTRTSMRASNLDDDHEIEQLIASQGNNASNGRRYSLRTRTKTQPLIAETHNETRRTGNHHHNADTFFAEYTKRLERFNKKKKNGSSRRRRRHRYDDSNSSSSSSSSSSDDQILKSKHSHRKKKHSSSNIPKDLTKADALPVGVDPSITWESVGGLSSHVSSLKEMVLLPLLYPEFFTKYDVKPPAGVLFYGPPGTGKTLMARALANACQGNPKISFFMRKGADCLSKWVGEAERQLRLLFEQAKKNQPSIIFFDEIDGLAPVRSAKQDQIHASIVSTLLALMDGLDGRGQVVVIGATNRVDAVDPALRRPGRFDREMPFTLPNIDARKQILKIHTKAWTPVITNEFYELLGAQTVGYCGADLKALCAESAMAGLRRRYPQIYDSTSKLEICVNNVRVLRRDFESAMKRITPASHRSAITVAAPVPSSLKCLLQSYVEDFMTSIVKKFPCATTNAASSNVEAVLTEAAEKAEMQSVYGIKNNLDCDVCHGETEESLLRCTACPAAFHPSCCGDNTQESTEECWKCPDCKDSLPASLSPTKSVFRFTELQQQLRVLVTGESVNVGQKLIGPALLHAMESLQVFSLDFPSLLVENSISPEEVLVRRFVEAKKAAPCILYLPSLDVWWNSVSVSMQQTLLMLLRELPLELSIMLVATTTSTNGLEETVRDAIFTDHPNHLELMLSLPTRTQRSQYFMPVFQACVSRPEFNQSKKKKLEVLKSVPIILKPPVLSAEEKKAIKARENHYCRELRIFLDRVMDYVLSQKRYSIFVDPVDPEVVPDYYLIISNPMCLSTMADKLSDNEYWCLEDFMFDLNLIVKNAQEYHPKHSTTRHIAHAAANMEDNILSYAHRFKQQQGYDLFAECRKIAIARKKTKVLLPKQQSKKLTENATTASTTFGTKGLARGFKETIVHVPDVTTTVVKRTSTTEEQPSTTEKVEEEEVIRFKEGDHVFVASRTFPGMNKLGGAAFVTSVLEEDEEENVFYSVKYVLGGTEKDIEATYVSKFTESSMVTALAVKKDNDNDCNSDSNSSTSSSTSRDLTPQELSNAYFDENIWEPLSKAQWTREGDSLFFPPGIAKEGCEADVDYFTTRGAVLAFVKSTADVAVLCFGKRYVEEHLGHLLPTSEEEEEEEVEEKTIEEVSSSLPDIEEEKEEEVSIEEEPEFIVPSQEELDGLLHELVEKTEGFNISSLQSLRVSMYQKCYAARLSYNRLPLLSLLKTDINNIS